MEWGAAGRKPGRLRMMERTPDAGATRSKAARKGWVSRKRGEKARAERHARDLAELGPNGSLRGSAPVSTR